MNATLPNRPQATSHKPHPQSAWSAGSPWCRCCGRTDRHHVRWGLCYFCADRPVETYHHRLSIEIRGELLELPGQCRDHTKGAYR